MIYKTKKSQMLDLGGRYLIIWKKNRLYKPHLLLENIIAPFSKRVSRKKRVEIKHCEVVDLLMKISAGEEGTKDTRVAI